MKHSDGETTTSPIPVSSVSSPTNNDSIVASPVGIPTTLPSNQSANATATSPPFKTPLALSNNSNIQRPRMATFNTIHNDKYSHSLRDFPLHHFDRNLTVEKATFDTALQSHVPSQQQTPLNVPLGTSTTSTSTIATTSTNATNHHDNSLIDTSIPMVGTPPARSSTTPVLHSPLTPIQIQDDTPFPASPSSSRIFDKSAAASTKRQDTVSQSPPRTALSNKLKSPAMKNEGEKRSTKKKKRKLPPVNGTATPSEVFHRNLVDAVSNVEDSDENEQYVYPYSHHDQSSITSSKKYHHHKKRHHLPANYRRSTAPSPSSPGGASILSLYHQQQYDQEQQQQANYGTTTGADTTGRYPPPRPSGGGTRGFLNDLLLNNHQHRSMSSFFKSAPPTPTSGVMDINNITYHPDSNFNQQQQHQQQQHHSSSYYTYGAHHRSSPRDEEHGATWIKHGGYHRPKLRSHVMDHPRSSNSFPQPWSHEVSSSEDYDDDDDNDHQPPYRRYHHDRYVDRLYLLRHPEQKKQSYCGGSSCGKIIRNTCISVFVFMLMLLIVTAIRAEPLTNVSASMGHILASDKELIFDLIIKANNWNWWTVRIQQADLSVFAFSEVVPFNATFGVDPAEYLGGCQQFDQPLSFTSSVILGQNERANTSTQIRIKSPGADTSGNQRWSRMIRYPFGLVTRGVIKYRPFPLFSLSPRQSISICVVSHVNPTSISSSPSTSYPRSYDDSDHGYCAHYPILPTMNK